MDRASGLASRRRIGQDLTEMETHAARARVAAAADELGEVEVARLLLSQVCADDETARRP